VNRWLYAHCGLRVLSDLRLPELDAGEPAPSGVDVDVRVILGPESEAVSVPRCIDSGGRRCRFDVPEAGSYDVRDGTEILVCPAASAEAELVRLFVLGSAWGVLLQQRGSLAMHAGVVHAGEGAVAFCGPSSAGKSSTVDWLARRGFPLVCDDLCRVDVAGAETPWVWPSARPLKLSVAALATAGRSAAGLQAALPRDKYQLPWNRRSASEPLPLPLPLRTIYLLEWGEPSLSRLSGATALRRFVAAATYRPELLDSTETARHWQRCLEIVGRVPIWELRRPRDWQAMDRVMDGLCRHLMSSE
jgi:hypothetical protein